MFRRIIRLKAILLVCSIISLGLAQTNRTSVKLSGTVSDPNEAVIPATPVTLKSLTDQTIFHAKTNEEGIFAFDALTSGKYELSVESVGFEKHIESISIENGNDKEVRVKLRFHHCPDSIKRLSDKEKAASKFCTVHNVRLKLDIVPIEYGLVVVTDEASKESPNSNRVYYGGCVVDCYERAEVLFCPRCRKTESK